MEEELISFETACLAHEVGFNLFAQHYYSKDGRIITNRKYPDDCFIDSIYATTQSLLQKWLREAYNIHITIHRVVGNRGTHIQTIAYTYKNSPWETLETYEEALEEALKAELTKIITKSKISPYRPS